MADSAILDGATAAPVVIPPDLAPFAPQVERLADAGALADLARSCDYTLADAIREGAGASDQAFGWGDADTACALSAGVAGALARGYLA